jgi:hypothetical protein
MGYRLLGAHISNTVNRLPEAIMDWKPPLVVLLDHSDVWHDVKAESPDTVFVGRIFLEFEPDFNDPNLDPVAAACDHCDKILPWAERMGDTYSFWQGVNEPIVASAEAMKRLAEFEAMRARIMAEHGFQIVVGNFSVGNPHLPYWKEFLPALEAARQNGGALALHEYAWPTLAHEWPWYLLRHRKVYDGEPAHNWEGFPAHLKTLPLLITECGLDGLIDQGHQPQGWKALHRDNPDSYLRQLAWYDAELQKDPYVVGAAIYCLAPPDSIWESYDVWPQLTSALAQQAEPLYRLPDLQRPLPPDQPPEEPEPDEQHPPEPAPTKVAIWKMNVAYLPGPRILAGSLPQANVEVTVTDPWGNASTVLSGTKPYYGAGGFEVLAAHPGTYKVSFQEKTFEVQTQERATIVKFEVEYETLLRGEEEEPGPPESPPILPPDEEAKLQTALEQMDRIIYALRLHLYGSIGTASMRSNGAIVLKLRVEDTEGMVSITQVIYPPKHPRHPTILSHVGGLQPGARKPVPPWPDEEADIL